MKIVEIKGDEGLVESGGLKRKANLSFIKSPKKGEYVLIHAGFRRQSRTAYTNKVCSSILIFMKPRS